MVSLTRAVAQQVVETAHNTIPDLGSCWRKQTRSSSSSYKEDPARPAGHTRIARLRRYRAFNGVRVTSGARHADPRTARYFLFCEVRFRWRAHRIKPSADIDPGVGFPTEVASL